MRSAEIINKLQADGWQLRLGNSSGYLNGWNGAAGSFGGVPQANTWYHLVGQFDGATGNGYAYVNGVQVKSAAVVDLANNSAATFNIGGPICASVCTVLTPGV